MFYKYLISSDKTTTDSLERFEKDKTVGLGEKTLRKEVREVRCKIGKTCRVPLLQWVKNPTAVVQVTMKIWV